MARKRVLVKKENDFIKQINKVANNCEQPKIAATLKKNFRRYNLASQIAIESFNSKRQPALLDWGCGIPILSILLQEAFKCTAFEPFANQEQILFAQQHGFEIQIYHD